MTRVYNRVGGKAHLRVRSRSDLRCMLDFMHRCDLLIYDAGSSKMVKFTASWCHGNAVVAENPPVEDGGLAAFNHFGWGTQITMRPGFARWFHIAIPAPVILDGQRMKLERVFLGFEQIAGHVHSASLQDVHLWDGRNRVAMKSARDFKEAPAANIDGHLTFELIQPREWFFGVGLSFKFSALPYLDGHFLEGREAPVVVIGSAGADFR